MTDTNIYICNLYLGYLYLFLFKRKKKNRLYRNLSSFIGKEYNSADHLAT